MSTEENESPEAPEVEANGERTVPYARFAEVLTRAKTAETRLEELKPVAEEVTGLRGRLSMLEADLQLADLGVADPEGRDIARYVHSKLGEGAPALSDWIAAQKSDLALAHPSVRPFLPSLQVAAPAQPASPPADAAPVAVAAPPAVPTANQGARNGTPAADVDANALRQARERYIRTKAPEDLRRMQELTALAVEQFRR